MCAPLLAALDLQTKLSPCCCCRISVAAPFSLCLLGQAEVNLCVTANFHAFHAIIFKHLLATLAVTDSWWRVVPQGVGNINGVCCWLLVATCLFFVFCCKQRSCFGVASVLLTNCHMPISFNATLHAWSCFFVIVFITIAHNNRNVCQSDSLIDTLATCGKRRWEVSILRARQLQHPTIACVWHAFEQIEEGISKILKILW